jgi:hypothetical protein
MAKNPLDALVKIDHYKPPRIAFLGQGGVGKTTTACDAPSPIVIQTEEGLGGIDVPAFPLCRSYEQFNEYVSALLNNPHKYKTLIIDSADWLENLIRTVVFESHTPKELEYARDMDFIAEEWRKVLRDLDQLRDMGMMIIFTVHSQLTKVDNPVHGSFDRLAFKMCKRSAPLLEEWCDIIFYCDYEMLVQKEDAGFGKKKNRIVPSDGRVMHTVGTPSMTAKNRYGLPEILPLSWKAFESEFKAIRASKKPKTQPEEVVNDI